MSRKLVLPDFMTWYKKEYTCIFTTEIRLCVYKHQLFHCSFDLPLSFTLDLH